MGQHPESADAVPGIDRSRMSPVLFTVQFDNEEFAVRRSVDGGTDYERLTGPDCGWGTSDPPERPYEAHVAHLRECLRLEAEHNLRPLARSRLSAHGNRSAGNERCVTTLLRLLTTAEAGTDPAWEGQVDIKARHELELGDGRRVLLLNDRGYGATCAWNVTTLADVEFQVRTVVGPDEPFDDLTWSDMEAAHWQALAAVARQNGVPVEGEDLQRLRHDVIISETVRRLVDPPE